MNKDEALPFGVGGGLVAIKTLLSRDPCVHAKTAIEMIDAILKEHPTAQPAVQEPVAVTYKEVADIMNALWGGTLEQVQIAMELANKKLYTTPPAQPALVQPVSGVVLRDGYPTLIQDKHIKETDQRLCILPTTPPAAQRQWVGLTDEEWQDLSDRYGMILFGRFKNEIEDKLKEKNT
jgi:hypothetical protein